MTEQPKEQALHYQINPEPVHFAVTGHDLETKLTRSVILKAVKKEWPLVVNYGVATLGGIVDSYLTKGLLSVVLSIFVAVVTGFIGFHMMREVITITKTETIR
jgi:hypothetical protein